MKHILQRLTNTLSTTLILTIQASKNIYRYKDIEIIKNASPSDFIITV